MEQQFRCVTWLNSELLPQSTHMSSHHSGLLTCRVTEVKMAAVKSVGELSPGWLKRGAVTSQRRPGLREAAVNPASCPCSDSCFWAPYVDSDSAPRGEGPCTAMKDTSPHQGHSQHKYNSFSFFFFFLEKWRKAGWRQTAIWVFHLSSAIFFCHSVVAIIIAVSFGVSINTKNEIVSGCPYWHFHFYSNVKWKKKLHNYTITYHCTYFIFIKF